MQQIKKKLYAAPRVKSVKFQVERGFESSPDYDTPPDCFGFVANQSLEAFSRRDPDPNWTITYEDPFAPAE